MLYQLSYTPSRETPRQGPRLRDPSYSPPRQRPLLDECEPSDRRNDSVDVSKVHSQTTKAGGGTNTRLPFPVGRVPPAEHIASRASRDGSRSLAVLPMPTAVSVVSRKRNEATLIRNPLFRAQGKIYFKIFVTTPEPTVRPPSRMANRTFASMAMGAINSTRSFTLSPGMHISAPPSN